MKTLKQLRTAAGLTQKDVATRMGVSNDSIKRWENSETHPNAPQAVKLAGIFGVGMDEIDWEAVQIRTPQPGDQSIQASENGEDLPQDAE